MKKLLAIATLLAISSWSVVNAQQQAPSLKPSMSAPAARPEGPPPLLLEIAANPALPPGYSNVNGPTELGKFVLVSHFARVPGSSQPSPPVRWVKVEPQFNGETVAVRVTLLRGSKGVEQEDFVGIYRLGIGETKTLEELRDIGIEPFTITLLDTVPPLPPPPAFVNDTKSIEIVSVRAENSPSPAYIITLRNLSEKNVRGVGVDLSYDGRPATIGFLQADEDRPLIEPGGVVEKYVRVLMARHTATGFVPSAASAIKLRLRSVVFSDLSYEGDVKDACIIESGTFGRKAYLTQALSLLDSQLEAQTVTDNIEAAKQFKEKVEASRFEVDAKASSVSPGCPDVAQRAFDAANIEKLIILRDLNHIITTQPRPPFSFRAWMEKRRTNYKARLARL
ncbi:MAG TPA: hypothetical protein VK868_01090 [Pyrinomonadaceae bacterium]|nr:hypothetical protein [Pyrinomonadaceae bacterium]